MKYGTRTCIQNDEWCNDSVTYPHGQPCLPPRQTQLDHGRSYHPPLHSSLSDEVNERSHEPLNSHVLILKLSAIQLQKISICAWSQSSFDDAIQRNEVPSTPGTRLGADWLEVIALQDYKSNLYRLNPNSKLTVKNISVWVTPSGYFTSSIRIHCLGDASFRARPEAMVIVLDEATHTHRLKNCREVLSFFKRYLSSQ